MDPDDAIVEDILRDLKHIQTSSHSDSQCQPTLTWAAGHQWNQQSSQSELRWYTTSDCFLMTDDRTTDEQLQTLTTSIYTPYQLRPTAIQSMIYHYQRKEVLGFRPKRRWNDVIRDDSDKMSVDLYTPRLNWCTANDWTSQ